jgi:hypothetical protein
MGESTAGEPSAAITSEIDSNVGAADSSRPRPYFDAGSSTDQPPAAAFEVNVHLASEEDPLAPTTVGVVTWSTPLGTPTSAKIQFGSTTEYGMEAPVDVNAEDLRTLLLGMKPDRTYHFRIVANVGGGEVFSDDYTIETGAAPEADWVSIVGYEVMNPERRQAGFVVCSYWSGDQSGKVFILDQDGDIVWWYSSMLEYGAAKAAISADRRDVWMVAGNGLTSEPLVRVGIDGLGRTEYDGSDGSHDIVAVEGDVMAYLNYGVMGVVEINRASRGETVFKIADFPLEPGGNSLLQNLNGLGYEAGKYVVSRHDVDVYVFPRAGATVGNTTVLSTVLGGNSRWGGYQHGVQLLPDNRVLVFANREGGDAGPSTVVEYDMDDGEEVWRHESTLFTSNYGGVQRLPGGNTLITYSNPGVIREVSPSGEVILEITGHGNMGYSTWLSSLYPASPQP